MLPAIIANMIIKVIENAEDKRIARSFHKRLKALEKDTHPRADWICMDCGCNAKKVEKPTRRK